jgi:hypothetical protein
VCATEPTVVAGAGYSHVAGIRFTILNLQTPMASDGQQEWIELYRGALMELDRAKLPQKIDVAHKAIQQRMNELLTSKDGHQEHVALEDALRNLRTLRRQFE